MEDVRGTGCEEYRKALEWIHGIGRFGMNPGLKRITALLERLGNPHHSLRFLHVAGTNGKGSTAVMAATILEEAGYRVGLYTSPYLVSFTNRMAVNGVEISPAELVELVSLVRPLVEDIARDTSLGQPTEFEVVTVLGFLFFARQKPDLVVLEAGLGGRLDATNVIRPGACVITNISLEHTAVLGSTIEAIAREKAGIIKAGAPAITASLDRAAVEVIAAACREKSVPLYRVLPPGVEKVRDFALFEGNSDGSGDMCYGSTFYCNRVVTEAGQRFSYCGINKNFDRLFIPLLGEHQCLNAATALTALEVLEAAQGVLSCPGGKLSFTGDAVRRGLARVRWPGRLEVLRREPLIVLDGAHNPAAVRLLARALPEHFPGRRLVLVLGILADKDRSAMLADLLPLADRVVATESSIPRACPAEKLAEDIRRLFSAPHRVTFHKSVGPALEEALQLASPEDLILVTGSLYTVSEARSYLTKGK